MSELLSDKARSRDAYASKKTCNGKAKESLWRNTNNIFVYLINISGCFLASVDIPHDIL